MKIWDIPIVDWLQRNSGRLRGVTIVFSLISIHLVSISTNLGDGFWIFLNSEMIAQFAFRAVITFTVAIACKEFLIFFSMITLRSISDTRFRKLNNLALKGRQVIEVDRNFVFDLLVGFILFIFLYAPSFFNGLTARLFYFYIFLIILHRIFRTDLLTTKKSEESERIEHQYRSTLYGLSFLAALISWDLGYSRSQKIIEENKVEIIFTDSRVLQFSLISIGADFLILMDADNNPLAVSQSQVSQIRKYSSPKVGDE